MRIDNNPTLKPPGAIIHHIPARGRKYIGSPSIVRLPDGQLIASHDYFRTNKLGLARQNEVRIYGSRDGGGTWQPRAKLSGFWHNLFVHREALYIMGPSREYGKLIIRRSLDGGFSWTRPRDASCGLLAEGHYHTAPMPMLIHNDRIWRAMEDTLRPRKWAPCFRAFMMSAPLDADLLDARSWISSNRLPGDASWLRGEFGGWLEGNAVLGPDGTLFDILRVQTPTQPEKAALVSISPDGRQVSFDPHSGFIDFPGGAKKFSIRQDTVRGCYWALANPARPEFHDREPIRVRNTLALLRSTDLRTWETIKILLEHTDPVRHAFQYVDWLLEGDEILAAVRTAFDDPYGGAHAAHDANYLTFHRFKLPES
jgi:hypothetical protein